jgi:hypothetical protein
MALADERRAGKIPEIKRIYLIGANMSIFQALLCRFDGQRPQIAVWEGSKWRFSDADYSHRSHIQSG